MLNPAPVTGPLDRRNVEELRMITKSGNISRSNLIAIRKSSGRGCLASSGAYPGPRGCHLVKNDGSATAEPVFAEQPTVADDNTIRSFRVNFPEEQLTICADDCQLQSGPTAHPIKHRRFRDSGVPRPARGQGRILRLF